MKETEESRRLRRSVSTMLAITLSRALSLAASDCNQSVSISGFSFISSLNKLRLSAIFFCVSFRYSATISISVGYAVCFHPESRFSFGLSPAIGRRSRESCKKIRYNSRFKYPSYTGETVCIVRLEVVD